MRKGPLRHKWFAAFTAAIGLGSIADEVARLALPLLVLDLTHSIAAAATLRVVQSLPYVFFGAPAGALIDRVDKRRLLIQLTTDGYAPYVAAVFLAFGRGNVDFAQLIKKYAGPQKNDHGYSPAVCVGAEAHTIYGSPDEHATSTSHVERQNLTMRMGMRRMTRLTNAFSKKLVNLENSVALHHMYYNFCRPHITLKGKTPAMAAGVAHHIWRIEEVIALLSPVVRASAA